MFDPGPFELFVLFVIFAPFVINARLSISRGKDVFLMLFLTIIFSWIVTLILAFLPEKPQSESVIQSRIKKFLDSDVKGFEKIKKPTKEELGEEAICPFCRQATYTGLTHCAWCENLINEVVPNQP